MKLSKSKKSKLICIICGLVAVACVLVYTNSIKKEAENTRNSALAKYGSEQIEVCVAKRNISPGETFDSSCYDVKTWLSDMLPDNAVIDFSNFIGKKVTSLIVSGEVISEKRFEDDSATLDVPAGCSAVCLPAKDIAAIGGAIKSGMNVDVYATGNTSTTLIAHNVLVLATSTSTKESSTKSSVSWVTVAVDPEMVQELVAASQKSSLSFVLPSSALDSSDFSPNS